MSAMSVALLVAAATATAVGAAALHATRGLRRQLTELRAELAERPAQAGTASVPAPRATPAEEIRAAVADALAEERERELAEARAFWAAQEARDAADSPPMLGSPGALGDETPVYLPRQADFAGLEPFLGAELAEVAEVLESIEAVDASIEAYEQGATTAGPAADSGHAETESPELAAARRRHPSNPDNHREPGSPAATFADHDRTMNRLEQLATDATPLTDVRPGPLGTLDVYVFADGTTICMTPGHRETAERLAQALREGKAPVLLGGSGISGAYALTFAYGDDEEETVYILADRVIASL
ncbi:hypothetical protein [Streptomyces sp. NPDC047108]|uniref:hypothetical protein n=1 Tax=Streptomyces sp. NPDC047108 TaxID=3155025 RepID=UPI003403B516